MERDKVIEVLLGLISIVLLLLLVFFVISISDNSEPNITNSYNVNSYNTYPEQRINTLRNNYDSNPYYFIDYEYYDIESGKRYLKYSDYSRIKKYDAFIGDDVNDYEVYIRNREYVGGYFKVVYHFEDYYGRDKSYTMTHYIPAREQKKFFFRDVTPNKYEHEVWWYTIDSLSEVPRRIYD